jgi:hypothetical protein
MRIQMLAIMMEAMKIAIWGLVVRFCIVGSSTIHAPAIFAYWIRTGELPGAEVGCWLISVTLGALLSGIAWYMSATAVLTKHLLVWHVAIVAQRSIRNKTDENQYTRNLLADTTIRILAIDT